MRVTHIPLEERLHTIDMTGCDPSILPQMVNALGNSPAQSFFLKSGDWKQMKELVGQKLTLDPNCTYRQLVWGIHALFETAESEEEMWQAQRALFLLAQAIDDMDHHQRVNGGLIS